jgi:hypothetical protein
MSTFKNNTGKLLILPGPTGGERFLADGDEFSDSNYYKRFCPDPLTLVADDGAPWVDGDPASGSVVKSHNLLVAAASTWTDNEVDYESLIGGPAHYIQIECTSGEVLVALNGNTGANDTFLLASGETQKFDSGDILVGKIQFDASYSGAAGGAVSIIATGKPS